MISRFSKTALVPAMAILAATSIPAIAQTLSRPVVYADLDLSSPAGRIKLDHRIAAAVRAVCSYDTPREFIVDKATIACRKAAMENALPQVRRAYAASEQRDSATVLASR